MNRDSHSFALERRLIPTWAIALAVLFFIGGQVLFHYLMKQDSNAPPEALQILLGGLVGGVLAVWILLLGYVTRDARRRGMRVWAWTLLVIFVPEGIGFIIYFILRKPVLAPCPRCGTVVPPPGNFCRGCGYQLAQTCARCGHAISSADFYCTNCGSRLRPSPEHAPQQV
ncbi:MAG TPA: zinc ribbon domain-containing protein [Acidobacteriota bacterium]|jgi:hypothetical protein